MRVDLRFAGLSKDAEARLRSAVASLASRGIISTVTPWDGTRCDLLAVNLQDGYGRHVVEIAKRRGIAMVGFGHSDGDALTGVVEISATANEAAIAHALQTVLSTRARPAAKRTAAMPEPAPAPATGAATRPTPPRRTAVSAAASNCALVRLATDANLQRHDLEASVRGRVLWLLPSAGRVVTASLSDQIGGRERLGEDGWEFKSLGRGRTAVPRGEIAASLDTFYVQGALRQQTSLPPFPDGRFGLRDWPDLGAAPDLIDPLKVVRILQRGAASPEEISARTELQPDVVSACLWAFRASGLLIADESGTNALLAAPGRKPAPPGGLLSRIAARFGLGR